MHHPASDIRRQATRLLDSAGISHEAGRIEEREVDAFDAELLMPEHLVREAMPSVSGAGVDEARTARV